MTVRTSPHSVLTSKLPHVGTTIPQTRDTDVFTVMSPPHGGAQETGAINLSQGFPDFPIDDKLSDPVNAAMKAGHNQYAPMPGLPMLRTVIAAKVEDLYGHCRSPKRR